MKDNSKKNLKQRASEDFSSIALTVASPEQISEWSYWVVEKPDTINYRTQKPEKWWLFCEKIFWPTKNWECACWKYKRIRYKWVICERCWVEVTSSIVRRERMAHIDLAVPIAHTWFIRSTPSRVWLLLDLPVKAIESIIYFASYLVISVDEIEQQKALDVLEGDFKNHKKQVKDDFWKELNSLKESISAWEAKEKDLEKLKNEQVSIIEELELKNVELRKKLEALVQWDVLTEIEWRDLSMKFWHVFSAKTWAESIRNMLENIDLKKYMFELKAELKTSSGQKQNKIIKKLRLVESLIKSELRPEWMILTKLPILPPDLRPMVQLDWWKYATADMNDLYRRVINRNNRLQRLMSIWAPEVICRNEKRMLQEAVDTLLNNNPKAWSQWPASSEKRKLKSLSDMLKWKQWRFRQNLLWKRVDYSWRSVIVVWPSLKVKEMWMPKEMAMKLFKPFVIWRLLDWEHAYNVKWAERMILSNDKIVWDLLWEIIADKYVLLNRAPTLHRLWIQAFKPVLIEWRAIQLHPLVCSAFNADFDGDQMAVHLPLSTASQKEARELMAADTNVLKPASWQSIITPTQDMVLWLYYLTTDIKWKKWEWNIYSNISEAINAYRLWILDIQALCKIRLETENWIKILDTTVWRAIFNSFLPIQEIWFKNYQFKKWQVWDLIDEIFNKCGRDVTVATADAIKRVWFKFATRSWLSIWAYDLKVPKEKWDIIDKWNQYVSDVFKLYNKWIISNDERYWMIVKNWAKTKNEITDLMVDSFKKEEENHIYYMVNSWARWNWGQITQLSWMKWLVASPSWKTIELPIKSNLIEWFWVLEYFNASHAWRKWKSDTALKTASAWYLTRKLVDSVQDVIIKEEDCWSEEWDVITRASSEYVWEKLETRILWRVLLSDLKDSKWKVFWKAWLPIDQDMLKIISAEEMDNVNIRSILWCKAKSWICKKCYWLDLWDWEIVLNWTPVWIIAAQAIWEPWTQLTMRTFHTWWVASEWWDMTQWLTRVEELFEARPPKTSAKLSAISWKVSIDIHWNTSTVTVKESELWEDSYVIPWDYELVVKVWDIVKDKQIVCKSKIDKNTFKIKIWWKVSTIKDWKIFIKHTDSQIKSYEFTSWEFLQVKDWDVIEKWTALNVWHYNLREFLEITNVLTVQKYMTKEIQKIYSQQWQTINDKHIEIVVKQMFSKIKITETWWTDFITWEVVDLMRFSTENEKAIESWKLKANWERLLLWLTRLSLSTDSWLSASSFQETIRILVDAAITKKVDHLRWLKENVIIWKLIPVWETYRKSLEPKTEEVEWTEE
jgi:DNA-directed RNA polymerase subunit beta'